VNFHQLQQGAFAMPDDASSKPGLKIVPPAAPENVFDDVEALRKIAMLKVSRRVVPVNVAVRKPPNNVFFRVRPEPEWSLDASVLIGDGGSDDFFFVAPHMLNHHVILPRLRRVTIATVYTWPGGAVSLWPVPNVEETRIACWKSARAAYLLAREQWVQLCWNNDLRDYDVAVAENITTEPVWPTDKMLSDLLRLGFADKVIGSSEHPYVKQLRGLTD
jgi:hypothetical protein